MIWNNIISYYMIFILIPAASMAGNLDQIQLTPNSITLIGESHQHPESIRLFQSLASDYLQQDKCLTVALEIASDQQDTIDKIGRGGVTAADIEIPSMIDHQPYRDMLDDLAALRNAGACLDLVAIDSGPDNDAPRDEWMAMQLAKRVGETPVLALTGNLHTLKRVNWDKAMVKYSPYVAEILASGGKNVRSFPQLWPEGDCANQTRFIEPNSSEALALLNSNLTARLNAFDYQSTDRVVDGIIVWECDKRPRGN